MSGDMFQIALHPKCLCVPSPGFSPLPSPARDWSISRATLLVPPGPSSQCLIGQFCVGSHPPSHTFPEDELEMRRSPPPPASFFPGRAMGQPTKSQVITSTHLLSAHLSDGQDSIFFANSFLYGRRRDPFKSLGSGFQQPSFKS